MTNAYELGPMEWYQYLWLIISESKNYFIIILAAVLTNHKTNVDEIYSKVSNVLKYAPDAYGG